MMNSPRCKLNRNMVRLTIACGAIVVAAFVGLPWSQEHGNGTLTPNLRAAEANSPAPLRRPVALALLDDGRWLCVANRSGGSVSLLDTREQRVVKEHAIGGTIHDLCATADGRFLLAVDDSSHELVLMQRRAAELATIARLRVSPYPVTVRVSRDGARCYVASLWSRRLTIIELALSAERPETSRMAVRKALDLPFAPRMQLLVKDDAKLIVADAFGGQLGIVDVSTGKLVGVRLLPAHNIRGLALSADGKKLLVSHQILNDLAETTHNDVTWGILMSNVLRWIVLERVLSSDSQVLEGSHINMTGDTQSAGGDPSAVAVTSDGQAVVAISGIDELGIGREDDFNLKRVPVGKRPTAVAVSRDGRFAYAANTFDDSISVVDLDAAETRRRIALGPSRELTLAERGETLFYSGRLSLNGWMSCHSCHTDGHSNGLLNDNLGDGAFGSAKRVLSLLGVGDTKPWAWNGEVTNLEAQVRTSITTTMQGRPPRDADVRALAAYLATLQPPPPLGKLRGSDAAAAARGKALFERQNCQACHAPPTYTSSGRFDVGLADKHNNREFNPPSLRGVSQRAPYFHDNRAASLQEVFSKHRHELQGEMPQAALDDLVAFLQSL
jgi:cytochrome c peroxidase